MGTGARTGGGEARRCVGAIGLATAPSRLDQGCTQLGRMDMLRGGQRCLRAAEHVSGEIVTMYAVIETGGKQYRVSPGQTLEVELLPAAAGDEIALDRVLLISSGSDTLVGTPVVPGARVTGTVVREARGPKIIVFHYKSKKRYRRTTGHRQDYTYLAITDIQANGDSLVSDDDRARYRRLAARAAHRYETELLLSQGMLEELVVEGRDTAPIEPASAEPRLSVKVAPESSMLAPAAPGTMTDAPATVQPEGTTAAEADVRTAPDAATDDVSGDE